MKLTLMTLDQFSVELASSSPAPGGGSASALAGVLSAALSGMVANLTVNKKGYENVFDEMRSVADQAEGIRRELSSLIDQDAESFNVFLSTMKLPKQTQEQKLLRAEKMQSALGGFFIDGVAHNISFLETIIYNEKFRNGNINTNFIKQEFSSGFCNNELESKQKDVLISVALYMFFNYQKRVNSITGGLRNINKRFSNKWVVDVDSRKFLCTVNDNDTENFNVDYGSGYSTLITAWQYGENVFRCTVNGNKVNVKILSDDYAGNYVFQYMGSVINITIRNTRISELEQFMPITTKKEKPTCLKSPISGRIVRIKVKDGDNVLVGSELCSIEAMKMENMIRSEFDLIIKRVLVQPDDIVSIGDILIEFE